MKITVTLLILLTLFLSNLFAQDSPQWGLPEGARARLGKGNIDEIQYSPDSTRLAVAGGIGIWLYDTHTLQEVALLTGHMRWVSSVAFSPDGTTLASGSDDATVRLWDAITGQHKRTLTGHKYGVFSVAFSPDGTTLASGSRDGTVWLWDAITGQHKQTLKGHGAWVESVAFSPDGQTLATGSSDKTVRLWDATTGQHKQKPIRHRSNVSSVAFSPDGQTLATGSWDYMVQLWDAITGQHKQTLKGHKANVWSVAFSPDGITLASGSGDATVRLWDAVTGQHKQTLREHTTGKVSSVAFSPNGTTLASGSRDGTVQLWDAITGQHKQALTGHTDGVYSVVFSPDGATLASGSRDARVRLWDAITGQHKLTLTRGSRVKNVVAFSPDGTTLASGSRDATVRLWDAITGQHKQTLTGHVSSVHSIAFSPDGTTLASGSRDATVRLWDAITGQHKQTLTGHTNWVNSVTFSPDGMTLASGSSDKTVRLWDAIAGRHKLTLTGHTARSVSSVAFSPDGTTLASGSPREIRLWDAITGGHKLTLTGHMADVSSVAFSPDGMTLASGSFDATVRLWDAMTGGHKLTLTGHTNWVYSVAFSPDGMTLASGSWDGTVLLWEFSPYSRATMSISPSSVPSPAIGAQLTLSLKIADGENVAGYQATVHFDATALRYVGSTNGDYLPADAFFVPPVVDANRVTLGATTLAGVSSGDGILATLTFEVVDVKESTLILSEVLLTNTDGELLPTPFAESVRIIIPAAVPSSAIVSVSPSPVRSPAIGGQLVFNVNIAGGQNVTEHQLAWEFDSTALRHVSSSQGDYLVSGVGNGDGRLMTGTFEVRAVKASTVSVSGYLTASNGLRYIPTFESAEVIVPLLGDVNRDGAVNILDLILVASSFSQQVSAGGNPADVNGDGVVNIVDLVKVAGALGNTGAAPSAHPQMLTMLTTTDVQKWLTQAQELHLTNTISQRGIIFLERLLSALMPKKTALLPNYPNPFNPETWIPYHLSNPADVTLTIYDTKGVPVRQFNLGYQPAGYYTDRTKAAYWDGRNESGESVGSGVYFYQFRAGNYNAIRRMVIVK